jgi:hypothetical protein
MKQMYEAVERLSLLIDTVPKKLESLTDEDFNLRPWLGIWSKKELLGHLVDRATICGQGLVRAQYEIQPVIVPYDSERWVQAQHYDAALINELIQLWRWYNRHLLHIVNKLSEEDLEKKVSLEHRPQERLKFFIVNYVEYVETTVEKITSVILNGL